jgi:hypothetical protein
MSFWFKKLSIGITFRSETGYNVFMKKVKNRDSSRLFKEYIHFKKMGYNHYYADCSGDILSNDVDYLVEFFENMYVNSQLGDVISQLLEIHSTDLPIKTNWRANISQTEVLYSKNNNRRTKKNPDRKIVSDELQQALCFEPSNKNFLGDLGSFSLVTEQKTDIDSRWGNKYTKLVSDIWDSTESKLLNWFKSSLFLELTKPPNEYPQDNYVFLMTGVNDTDYKELDFSLMKYHCFELFASDNDVEYENLAFCRDEHFNFMVTEYCGKTNYSFENHSYQNVVKLKHQYMVPTSPIEETNSSYEYQEALQAYLAKNETLFTYWKPAHGLVGIELSGAKNHNFICTDYC